MLLYYFKVLPFESILSCGATSKMILHDAMPLLTTLHIDKSSQLNLNVAYRFRDIKTMHINSLLKMTIDEDFRDIYLDFETKIRIVPFLSRFSSLERVFFGVKDEDGDIIEDFPLASEGYFYAGDESYPDDGSREEMLQLLDNISGAFSCGALPKNLNILGLVCPDATDKTSNRGDSCDICMRACKSFPLQSVVEFECRGTSSNNTKSGRSHGLDVCLERAKLESIIESRPGGKEMLHSEDRLLRLLGRGRRYKIPSQEVGGDIELTSLGEEGNPLYIVKYKEEELDEIKRVIQYAELDVKKLCFQKVSRAIMSSFSSDESGSIVPPKHQRLFSESSLNYLKDELGLPFSKGPFQRPLADMMQHTKQFVWVLNQGDAEVNEDATESDILHHRDIELDSLKLIRQFLQVGGQSIIQQCTDGITSIANYLNGQDESPIYKEATAVLMMILTGGGTEEQNMVIDTGALNKLLDSSNEYATQLAISSLKVIASNGIKDHIDNIVNSSAFPKLIGFLDSEQMIRAEKALIIIAEIISKGTEEHIEALADAGIVPKLVKLLESGVGVESSLLVLNATIPYTRGRQQLALISYIIREMDKPDQHLLSSCTALLREIVEADLSSIQIMMKMKAISKVIDVIYTTRDDTIRTNLSHLILRLLSGTKNQIEVLAQESELLDVLVTLIESEDKCLSEKAILTADRVADICHHLLLDSGIVEPLLRVLKDDKSNVDMLRNALQTFITCCRGKLGNIDMSKASLKVMRRLLLNDDEAVVSKTCWSLYHIIDELNNTQVNEVMNMRFVRRLLNVLPDAPYSVQLPALKSIYLISTSGDDCINAITLHNGTACISKALSTQTVTTQKLACSSLANVISGKEEQIQIAIDNNAVPYLLEMLTKGMNVNKKNALWAIYQITKGGNASQIKYLVSDLKLSTYLCDSLIGDQFIGNTDYSNSIMALWALKLILTVGKKHAEPNYSTSKHLLTSGIVDMESRLTKMTDKYLKLEQNNKKGVAKTKFPKKTEIDELKYAFERLFNCVNIASVKRKRRRIVEDSDEDEP